MEVKEFKSIIKGNIFYHYKNHEVIQFKKVELHRFKKYINNVWFSIVEGFFSSRKYRKY